MPHKKILLNAVHGSYLYGLNTPLSDKDYYEIYDFPWKVYRPKKQNKQVINSTKDTTSISVEKFTELCIKGVPQSIEVLFSDDSKWLFYDHSWYHKRDEVKSLVSQHIPSVLETYRRTAWNFFEKDDFKKNRHALRLCHNARDLKEEGSFNPTLLPNVRDEITRIAQLPRRQREDIFKDVFYETFGDL